jgi:hypothetical protein
MPAMKNLAMHGLRAALAAGTMLLALSATAAGLKPAEVALVRRGMTSDELRQAVGAPLRRLPAPSRGGSTWVYALEGQKPTDGFVLDVELNSDGKVLGSQQRLAQEVY